MRYVIPMLLATLLAAAMAVHAEGDGTNEAGKLQPLDSIRETVLEYLSAELAARHNLAPEIEVGSLDPRLRLTACSVPLEPFLPSGGKLVGNTTIGVRCSEPKDWTLYVSADVAVYDEVLVAGRYLARGTRVEAADLVPEKRDLAKLPYGYFVTPDDVIGMVTTRSVTRGAVLTPSSIKETPLVRRNDKVNIIATSGGLEVHAAGIALEDGRKGERIQVRNVNSKRVVEGVIIGPGVVEVQM